jgi:hypothetical protein
LSRAATLHSRKQALDATTARLATRYERGISPLPMDTYAHSAFHFSMSNCKEATPASTKSSGSAHTVK